MPVRTTDTERAPERMPAKNARTIMVTPPTSAAVSVMWRAATPAETSEGPVLPVGSSASHAALDDVDRAMLRDERLMRHINAAAEAHERDRRGEEVDWDRVIEEHIL